MASEQVTQLIGTQDVQIESSGETESEEDVEQVLGVESGKTKGQEGSAREVVYRYWKRWKWGNAALPHSKENIELCFYILGRTVKWRWKIKVEWKASADSKHQQDMPVLCKLTWCCSRLRQDVWHSPLNSWEKNELDKHSKNPRLRAWNLRTC